MEKKETNELEEMRDKIKDVADAMHRITLRVMETCIVNAAKATDRDIERYEKSSCLTRFYWKRKMVKSICNLNELIGIYNDYVKECGEDDKQKPAKDMP